MCIKQGRLNRVDRSSILRTIGTERERRVWRSCMECRWDEVKKGKEEERTNETGIIR